MIDYYSFYTALDRDHNYDRVMSDPKSYIPDSLEQWSLVKDTFGYDSDLIKKIDFVISAFRWKFDDDHLDFAFMSDTHWLAEDPAQYSRMMVIVKYDSIDISNSLNQHHTIKDLYVYFTFVFNQLHFDNLNKKYLYLRDITMHRGILNFLEAQNNYIFSHYLDGCGCCFGATTLNDLVIKIGAGDYDENEIKLLLLSFDNYLSYESLEGVPYRKLSTVNNPLSPSISRSIQKTSVLPTLNESSVPGFVQSMASNADFYWNQLDIQVNDFVEVFPNNYLYNCVFNHLLENMDLVRYMMYSKEDPFNTYIIRSSSDIEGINFQKRFYFKCAYHKIEIDVPQTLCDIKEEQKTFIRNTMAIREDVLMAISNLLASAITYHMSIL